MPLKFHPEPGTILICDFSGFKKPEMIKRRPVVVVSPRLKRRNGLLTIVPLSTTPPDPIEEYHCNLKLGSPLPEPYDSLDMWVKADMIYNVSFDRVDLLRTKRDHTGQRKYLTRRLDEDDFRKVLYCVLMGLGLPHLTKYV